MWFAFFKKLPPCLVGIEACATSHHWSRELQAVGHTVRLILPAYVKPYVKRQKNDAADAEASSPWKGAWRFHSCRSPTVNVQVLGVHCSAVEPTHPDAVVRRSALFARHPGIIARAVRRGGANMRGRSEIDFAITVGVGADGGTAARRIGAEPARLLRDSSWSSQ